jgi:hypothetical protein
MLLLGIKYEMALKEIYFPEEIIVKIIKKCFETILLKQQWKIWGYLYLHGNYKIMRPPKDTINDFIVEFLEQQKLKLNNETVDKEIWQKKEWKAWNLLRKIHKTRFPSEIQVLEYVKIRKELYD